jgi:D-3-phosphoglycerate dehydrogenase
MPKILVTDKVQLGDARFEGVELHDRAGIGREELLRVAHQYDAIITRSRTQVDEALLAAAPHLRVIGRGGVGVDNIDLDAASRRGVVVLNAPEANNVSAAELAVALMLCASRGVARSDRMIRGGAWDRTFLGREVKGRRLGIVGLGRIGSLVARRAQALGMSVLAYDPYISRHRAEELRVELLDELDAMLARSDVLTVHTPLTDETLGMIGAEKLARMPRGAIVINAARGGVVDERALADALASGQLFGAGLDVFRVEPPAPDHPLLGRDDVVLTAHLGANTEEAQARVGAEILERTVQALRGDYERGVVNAPALSSEVLRDLGPHLELGETLGATAVQLVDGRVREIAIEFAGDFPRDPDPIATAVTKGFLEPILNEPPNYVNAAAIARERDIRIAKTTASRGRGYTSWVEVTARSDEGETRVAGSVLAGVPRIVEIDGYPIEIKPEGAMLICTNVDRPGAVGKVGTVLGDAGVNIVGMQLSRVAEDGRAMFALTLDQAPEEQVLDVLRALSDVILSLRLVRL